ncbi:TPA: glycosyltransferase family 2 protein, partial [Streptococcus suis]
GLLDENIFLFYEEDAIAHKLYKAELQALLLTDQKIIHFGSITIGTQGTTYYLNRYKSSMYVLKKYCEINNFQLSVLFLLNYFSLLLKCIKNNEYQKACKELLNYYIELCRGT